MLLMIRPATTGPKIGTTTIGRLTALISRPICFWPAACTSSVVSSGTIRPPPMPCTTRNAIRLPMFHAAPEATEPARNGASENAQTSRPPNRARAQPLSGMTMANESRYPVITHWIVATVVCRSRPIVSTATLTIAVSSSEGTAPTSRTMISLITAGSRRSRGGVAAGAEAAGPPPAASGEGAGVALMSCTLHCAVYSGKLGSVIGSGKGGDRCGQAGKNDRCALRSRRTAGPPGRGNRPQGRGDLVRRTAAVPARRLRAHQRGRDRGRGRGVEADDLQPHRGQGERVTFGAQGELQHDADGVRPDRRGAPGRH